MRPCRGCDQNAGGHQSRGRQGAACFQQIVSTRDGCHFGHAVIFRDRTGDRSGIAYVCTIGSAIDVNTVPGPAAVLQEVSAIGAAAVSYNGSYYAGDGNRLVEIRRIVSHGVGRVLNVEDGHTGRVSDIKADAGITNGIANNIGQRRFDTDGNGVAVKEIGFRGDSDGGIVGIETRRIDRIAGHLGAGNDHRIGIDGR